MDGWGLLAADEDDWLIGVSVLRRCQKQYAERRKDEIESLGKIVGYHVARHLARALKSR